MVSDSSDLHLRSAEDGVSDSPSMPLCVGPALHLGTSDEIREKLLQHRGLQDLVGRASGDGRASDVRRTQTDGKRVAIDEGVAAYLQMLKPRAKSPPRFPD